MPSPSVSVILGSKILMLVLGLAYLRRYWVRRPPVGVINRSDVMIAVLIIILAHVLHVVVPVWAAAGLFALAILSALYCTLEPLFRLHLAAQRPALARRDLPGSAYAGAIFLLATSLSPGATHAPLSATRVLSRIPKPLIKRERGKRGT